MGTENNRFGELMVGFLIGGLVGASIAVLKAPRSGEETRAQIRAKGLELRETAEQTMDETLESVKATARDMSNRADELRAQSQATLDESQEQWLAAIDEIKRAASESIDEIKSTASQAVKETEKAATEAG